VTIRKKATHAAKKRRVPEKGKTPSIHAVSLSKPSFTDEDLEIITQRIKETLISGWLTSGPLVKSLEDQFARFVGTREAVALNSCTAGLHAVLLALGVKSGDEVIVPSDTFVATANAAVYVGARPVFADSDSNTFNISPEEIRRKISPKTKAIITVHLAGNPCNMNEIIEIAKDHNVPLIEDCAHAHGAMYRGSRCGTFGVAGVFSFYPTKIVTAAEGGMITTNDAALAQKARVVRNHGRAAFGPAEIVDLGYNYRLSEIHAAVGLAQFKHINAFISLRNKLAKIYNRELVKIKWIKPQLVENGNLCSYYTYAVKLTEEAPLNRDALMQFLKNKGIEASVMYHPVHLQPYYMRLYGHKKGELPVAEELGNSGLALPLHNRMKAEDVRIVVTALREASEESG
jgi:perosamine synthetase